MSAYSSRPGRSAELTDRQLLERFRTRDGEAAEWAFAALVERHGPMILRVCRRTLRDEHSCARRLSSSLPGSGAHQAGSLRAGARWAAGPTPSPARRSLRPGGRRPAASTRARAALTVNALTVDANEGGDDLWPRGSTTHEIGRLPGPHRTAVVLCDLEGLTQDQAAQRLGCPSGTVRSRLARGRGRLRARLIRRGLTPSGGAMAALLASEGATAAVPAVLMEATVRLATFTATGQMIAGAGSATALSAAVLRALFMIKLKWISTAVLVLGLGARWHRRDLPSSRPVVPPPLYRPATGPAIPLRRRPPTSSRSPRHRLKTLPTWSSSRAKLRWPKRT